MDPTTKKQQIQSLTHQKQPNIIGDSMAKVFDQNIKVHRPSKIIFKGDQTKQILRSAVSGSVKQKLNLENTKLKINIDNLSSMLSIHQNNETQYKIEINRYREKLAKYKQRIKEKDVVIGKLLEKLERKIQLDSGGLQNLLIKLHQNNLKGFKYKIGQGENLDVKEVLSKYQELLKGFAQQQKQRIYLQAQKKDLEQTVKQLRQTIKFVGENQYKNSEQQHIQVLKNRLVQTQQIMKKQKNAIQKLVSSMRQSNVQITPQIKSVLDGIQKDHQKLVDNVRKNGVRDYQSINGNVVNLASNNNNSSNTAQIFTLRQRLALSQTNLFKQKQQRKQLEKTQNLLKQKLSNISHKIVTANSNQQNILRSIRQISDKYAKQAGQLRQKIESLLSEGSDIERYQAELEELAKKFRETVERFGEESAQWSKLQLQFQAKLGQYRQNNRILSDRIDKQIQKRRIFQLKIMSQDQQNNPNNIPQEVQDTEQKQLYLDQRVSYMRSQSIKNKKQNQVLVESLERQKRAFQILERELKEGQERIFMLESVLRDNNIEFDGKNAYNITSPQNKNNIENIKDKIKQQTLKTTQNLSRQNLQQKIIQANYHINFLQNQNKQLRHRNIQKQIQYQSAKKQFQIRDSYNLETIQKIKTGSASKRENSQRVLKPGEEYIEQRQVQGKGQEYNINIININQIPSEIQELTFEQLVNKYQSAKQQILYLKQKLQQVLINTQTQNGTTDKKQKIPSSQNYYNSNTTQKQNKNKANNNINNSNSNQGESILNQQIEQSQEQEPHEHEEVSYTNSQQIDEDTYRNINQEMDRLINKNKLLQRQLQNIRNQLENRIRLQQKLNQQIKEKLKSAEELNNNFSNIVVHLEGELSRYQSQIQNQNQNTYGQQDANTSSIKRQKQKDPQKDTQIKRQIQIKKKQFQDMLKSQSSIVEEDKLSDYQNKLKNLQLQIRQLQEQSQKSSVQKYHKIYNNKQDKNKDNQRQSQSYKSSHEIQHYNLNQCPNCQSVLKINGQLIRKIAKIQQSRQQKQANTQQQFQRIEKQYQIPSTSSPQNYQQLLKQNKHLKQLLAQLKTTINFSNREQQDYQLQITNLREINEELVSSIHEKQKMLLKLRTEMYRQDYERQGVDQDSLKRIDEIISEYDKKVNYLEGIVKGQEKSQLNLTDLYDTINYLNNQCEMLRKTNQVLTSQIKQKQNKLILQQPQTQKYQQKLPQYSMQIPSQPQLLQQKYRQLTATLSKIQKTLQQNNYQSIKHLLQGIKQQKQRNIQLMRQNNKLQNKIQNMNIKTQEYFKKINQGQIYQIIQDKDRQIDVIKQQNQGFKNQLENLASQRHKMFVQNQKINQDLKSIEENIQKLTGNKFSFESTGVDRSSLIKNLQKSGIQQPNSVNYSSQHSSYILKNITKKLQKLKNTIQNSPHKTRPNFQTQSFQQIPSLQDIIIMLLDRLHFVWNLVQQRTAQYNELRDEMNIISMECMKNSQFQLQKSRERDREGGNDTSRVKVIDIIEQRYEQVLAELIQYENQNKRLQRQVYRLKTQLSLYKKQVQQVQQKYITISLPGLQQPNSQPRSQSSDQPLPYNKQILNKLLEPGNITTLPIQKQIPQIIKLFLARIKQLQTNLQTIQLQFDEKNKKLESIIQKQKSFISEKSRLHRSQDQSSSEINPLQLKNNPTTNNPNQPKKQSDRFIAIPTTHTQTPNPNTHPNTNTNTMLNIMDQKSYSHEINSLKLFKQIEQLTKNNQELTQYKIKYRQSLNKITRVLQSILERQQIKNVIKQQLENIVTNINQQLSKQMQEEQKKDNSGFDLQGDMIIGSSFGANKQKFYKNSNSNININTNVNTQDKFQIQAQSKSQLQSGQQLEQFVKNKQATIKPKQKSNKSSNTSKQQQKNIKRIQNNNIFIEQNKFLFNQIIEKISKITGISHNIQNIKNRLSTKLSDKQLQELFYKVQVEDAATKILNMLADAEGKEKDRKVKFEQGVNKNILQNNKQFQQQKHDRQQLQIQQIIQQGEWVQTQQLQSIINQIYPTKSQLCIIVANSINMLMLAQTKQGILKAIQFLFINLKNKQIQYKQQVRRRDEAVTQYGRKLQKLLVYKYSENQSEEQSQDKSSMVNQNSFRRTTEIVSEYQIKKQEEKDRDNQYMLSMSKSQHSRNVSSGVFEKSL